MSDQILKLKVYTLHHYLKNIDVSSLEALKVFITIYGLKRFECNSNEYYIDKIISDKMSGSTQINHFSDLIFYNSLKNFDVNVLTYLFEKVSEIIEFEKENKTSLNGRIYEYFNDTNTKSNITNYDLVKYIYQNKLRDTLTIRGLRNSLPHIKADKSDYTMLDMFAGSGEFTKGFISASKSTFEHVFHFNTNEDLVKIAAFEMLCLTNKMPDTKNNFKQLNAFTHEFDKKYDYIFTNPPYGCIKNKKTESQKNRILLKTEITKRLKQKNLVADNLMSDDLLSNDLQLDDLQLRKKTQQLRIYYQLHLQQLEKEDEEENAIFKKFQTSIENSSSIIRNYAKQHNLLDTKLTNVKLINDKEFIALILTMALLAPGGLACCLLRSKIVCDDNFKEIRKVLIKNFNVKEIIYIKDKTFKNFKKNYIVIFENTNELALVHDGSNDLTGESALVHSTPVHDVAFSKLVVKKHTSSVYEMVNDKLTITANIGDIKDISTKELLTVSKEDILKNNVSFDYKNYVLSSYIINKDYEYKTIGEMCEVFDQDTKCECIIIKVTDNNYYVTLGQNRVGNENEILIKTKYNKYIYASLYGNCDYLKYGLHFKQSIKQSIQQLVNRLFKIKLPFPKSEERLNYWENRLTRDIEAHITTASTNTYTANDIVFTTILNLRDEALIKTFGNKNNAESIANEQTLMANTSAYGLIARPPAKKPKVPNNDLDINDIVIHSNSGDIKERLKSVKNLKAEAT